MNEPISFVAADWNVRLCRAFQGIFVIETVRRGRQTVIQAHSQDERAFWEAVSQQGVLHRARLRLALPGRDDLENVKLGCWTLLFLKSVLPEWLQLEDWIQECGAKVAGQVCPIERPLSGYTVACQFLQHLSFIEYRVAQAA